MTIQFALTVNEGKYLIAKAISELPEVREAISGGKLVLKGGTTVSLISELLFDLPLRISGRMTKRGAVSAASSCDAPHTVAWENGKIINLDETVDEYTSDMGPGDVIVTGANIIDSEGNGALLAGSKSGGLCGRSISAWSVEGAEVIIAAGLEKLIPGRVADSVRAAHRKNVDLAMGMACGLFPVTGRLVTEIEAVEILTGIKPVVIGRGGICGAEGGVLFQAEGENDKVERLSALVNECKGKETGGDIRSLKECSVPSPGCRYHLSCMYRSGNDRTKR